MAEQPRPERIGTGKAGKVPAAARLVTGLRRFDEARLWGRLRHREAQCQREQETATISIGGAPHG